MPSTSRLAAAPDFERHQRKCIVCRHEDRATIEEYFVNWFRPGWIASFFQITEDSLYRHVFATGLYDVRATRVRTALEHIIERVLQAPVTTSSVVDAVRAYTRIDSRGHWSEPPTTHIVIPGAPVPQPAASRREPKPPRALRSSSAAHKALQPPISSLESPVQTTNQDSGACASGDAGALVSNRKSGELENATTR